MIYHFWDKETFEYTESLEVKPGRVPANGEVFALPAWDTESQKLVRDVDGKKWIVKSLKEFTEHLISIGHKTKSDFEKVNDAGEIVALSESELTETIAKLRVDAIKSGVLTKEQVLTEKLAEITDKARDKIIGGFESKAKGQWYIYDSKLEDQFNMMFKINQGKNCEYRCTKKSDGVKDSYPHTNAQLFQIISEFADFNEGIREKARIFKKTVNAMTSALEINSVVISY